MNYSANPEFRGLCVGSPEILLRDDYFLSLEEVRHYQGFLQNQRWGLSESSTLDQIQYISQDLYRHYAWDGRWEQTGWLDSTAPDWEWLYKKISLHLPPHYLHWCDVKITGPLQGGVPIHRDQDPWSPGGDIEKFSQAISILCNLNTNWDASWGGGFVLHDTKMNNNDFEYSINQIVPIVPGQLLIVKNCAHSVELITEPCQNRISLILHVLQYRQNHNDTPA